MLGRGKSETTTKQNFFFEHAEGDIGQADSPLIQAKKPRQGYICKRCNSDQHFFKDCPQVETRGKYICHICSEPGHHIRDCPSKQADRLDTSVPSACWFCLSNPAIRKHLIIHIGDTLYVTLAKGGLVEEHFLAIPIEHHSSTTALQPSTVDELNEVISKISTALKKDLLIFAHRHNPSHHLHFQIILIPDSGATDDFMLEFSKNKGYPLEQVQISNLATDAHQFICWVAKENATGPANYFNFSHEPGKYFPTSFGREMAAEHLGVTERLDWKKSPLTEDDEKLLVEKFKNIINF